VVEEFFIARGSPSFGEQPHVRGDLVVYKRGARGPSPGLIYGTDISMRRFSAVPLAEHPVHISGILLGDEHLYWPHPEGGINARRVAPALGEPFRVSTFGSAQAVSRQFLFFQDGDGARGPGVLYAKAVAEIAAGDEAIRPVAAFKQRAALIRARAASERHFVWVDRDPEVPGDTWKVYAKTTESLFAPGAERLVLDTKMYTQGVAPLGVMLALHDRYLLVPAAEAPARDAVWGIYLVDLEGEREPLAVTTTETRGVPPESIIFRLPAISAHYMIWSETTFPPFEYHLFGQALREGRPSGEVFPIGTEVGAGDWITIDRNIVVWNGNVVFHEGGSSSGGIMVAELALPDGEGVGDANGDGAVNVTDVVVLLDYLFSGGKQPRLRLADADLSRAIEPEDALVILEYLFLGGPQPGT
jgi:hypothetical protein